MAWRLKAGLFKFNASRSRPGIRLCTVMFGVSLLALMSPVQSATKQVTIGIVSDGVSTRLDTVIEKIKVEVKTLTDDEFDVRFPLAKRVHGNWQISNIQAAFGTLSADP